MTKDPPTVEEVDLLGQVCPASLLIALRRVNERKGALREGSRILLLRTDNRESVGTITDTLESMGFRVDARKEGDHYALAVSSPAGGAP